MDNEVGKNIWNAFKIVEKTHEELISLKKNFRELLQEKLWEYSDKVKAIWMNDYKAHEKGWCYYSNLLFDFKTKDWAPDDMELNTNNPFWTLRFENNDKKKLPLSGIFVSIYTVLYWSEESSDVMLNSEPQIFTAITYLGKNKIENMETDAAYDMLNASLGLDIEQQLEVLTSESEKNSISIKEIQLRDDQNDKSRYPEKILYFSNRLVEIGDENMLIELIVNPTVDIIINS